MVLSIDGVAQNLINLVWAVYDIIQNYVTALLNYFEFDNPKKTFMLSLLMLFGVVLVIAVFSSTPMLVGGVTNVNGESKITLWNAGDESIVAGNKTFGGGNQSKPPTGTSECLTDDDCRSGTGSDLSEGICCLPERYEGYWCAGYCLSALAQNREACKLPGSCKRNLAETQQYVKNLPNSCMNADIQTARRDSFCQERTASTTGYNSNGQCCQTQGTPCFGMCLKDKDGASCNDYSDCYEEKEVIVKAISSNEI